MKKLNIILSISLMVIILAVLLLFMCLPLGQTKGSAENGTLDLRPVDLSAAVYQLTGDWQYAQDRILEPSEFPGDAPLIGVPDNWGGEGSSLNSCATYRLTILTEDSRLLMLYVPEIYSAYRLYINGRYERGAGVVADNPEEGSPSFESVLIPVVAEDGRVEIVVQASTYHWMRPHMNNIMKLGEHDALFSWFFRTRTLYILAMGFILASAFYHFALYFMRRKMSVYLLFSLLCLFCFWRLALETDGISDLTGWFSMATGVLDARIFLVLFFLHAAFIAMFSLYVFDRQWIARHLHLTIIWCVAGAAAFSLLPMNVAWLTTVFSVAAALPMLFALYKAVRSRVFREGSVEWLYIIALVLYVVVGFFSKYFADHLLYMTPVLTNMYMIMAESVILARQYSEMEIREQEMASKTAAMEQSAKVRAYMIDTLSHEVRTPLTVMSSYAQLAAERISDGRIDDLTLTNLKKISDESKRLADLASNTLRLSRLSDIPDGGGFAPVDLGELTRQVVRLFEPMASKNGRELTLDLPGEPLPVLGSADSLTRLLWNLLDNALTHGGHGGIEIMVCPEGAGANSGVDGGGSGGTQSGGVRLVVRDHGDGVRPELLPKVFEHGISGRQDGTGIGLSMCRDIAHEMNGEIAIASEAGKGATVTVTFPGLKG